MTPEVQEQSNPPVDDGSATPCGSDRRTLRPAWEWAAVGTLLALGLVLRLTYAWELPLTLDEQRHFEAAETISLAPEAFHLPIVSEVTNHPMLSVYVTALGRWLGSDSVFVVRTLFVACHVFGLAGLYLFARRLGGWRVGLLTLYLGITDRFLVAQAPIIVETLYLAWIPWTLLMMYRAWIWNRRGDWVVLGVLLALGYWTSQLFPLIAVPFAALVVLTSRGRRCLVSPGLYGGAIIGAALIAPCVLWSMFHGAADVERHAGKVAGLGLSPRFLLLFIGDLLICLRSTDWVVTFEGHKMYLHQATPCFWPTGLAYLLSTVYMVRHAWHRRVGFALAIVAGVIVPVTILNPREPWNEFTWAAMAVFPMLVLTARLATHQLWRQLRRPAVIGLAVLATLGAVRFLAGPKYGYRAPCPEKAFVGQVLYALSDSEPAETRTERARAMIERAKAERPDSPWPYFFEAMTLPPGLERNVALNEVEHRDPGNLSATNLRVIDAIQQQRWVQARRRIEKALTAGHEYFWLHLKMAECALHQHDFDTALAASRRTIELKPDEPEVYKYLGLSHAAHGQRREAEAAIVRYAHEFHYPSATLFDQTAAFLRSIGRSDEAGYWSDQATAARLRRPDPESARAPEAP